MTVQEHEPWRSVIGLVELMHATVGSRSAEFGMKNIARGVWNKFILHEGGAYLLGSITSEASNKVLTVKMLFDFHFCFSKTVRKNR